MYDTRDVIVNGESLCVNETAHCPTQRAKIPRLLPQQDAHGRGLSAATSIKCQRSGRTSSNNSCRVWLPIEVGDPGRLSFFDGYRWHDLVLYSSNGPSNAWVSNIWVSNLHASNLHASSLLASNACELCASNIWVSNA